MKKLLTLCAIAFTVYAANAGAITWQIDDIMGPGGTDVTDIDGSIVPPWVVYLFTITPSTTPSGQYAVSHSDINQQLQKLALGQSPAFDGSSALYQGTTYPEYWNGVDIQDIYDGVFEGNTSMFFVLFNAETIGEATHYYISSTKMVSIPTMSTSAVFYYENNNGWAIGELGEVDKWIPIPEPATMALLGVGVVALGLRRRRK